MIFKSNSLSENQLKKLHELLTELDGNQKIWLAGYLEGFLSSGNSSANLQLFSKSEDEAKSNIKLTVVYGSETGHSERLAEKLAEKASFKGIKADVFSLYDYEVERLAEEVNLAIIVSTHGEGDPAEMAEDFVKYITGNEAPLLPNLNFSVLALGDKTYKNFCQGGVIIDEALKALSAVPVLPIVKCDVDYEQDSEIWMNNFLLNLSENDISEREEIPNTSSPKQQVAYSKKNPFLATVLEKEVITGEKSERNVYHVELSLEGSGLEYQPGDSLGVFPKNPADLVEQILQKTAFDPEQLVDVDNREISIFEALSHYLEITIVNFDVLTKYYEITKNPELKKILDNDYQLDEYLFGHDVLDLLEDFPFTWNARKFAEVLRPLLPRLYSISSSQERVGEEVHITVAEVKYERNNRLRKGACSAHLAENIDIDDEIPVYIEKNPLFKLPANGSKIIMVGAGTGIAPYRAFMQDRETKGIKGKSWLIFGDRYQDSDYLYEREWKKLTMTQFLDKVDVAFSRDQKQKIYVQHKLQENKEELYKWIQDGAYFYLCGDMNKMAKGVNQSLVEIFQTEGKMSEEEARKYIKQLKREKRFQTDVY